MGNIFKKKNFFNEIQTGKTPVSKGLDFLIKGAFYRTCFSLAPPILVKFFTMNRVSKRYRRKTIYFFLRRNTERYVTPTTPVSPNRLFQLYMFSPEFVTFFYNLSEKKHNPRGTSVTRSM